MNKSSNFQHLSVQSDVKKTENWEYFLKTRSSDIEELIVDLSFHFSCCNCTRHLYSYIYLNRHQYNCVFQLLALYFLCTIQDWVENLNHRNKLNPTLEERETYSWIDRKLDLDTWKYPAKHFEPGCEPPISIMLPGKKLQVSAIPSIVLQLWNK